MQGYHFISIYYLLIIGSSIIGGIIDLNKGSVSEAIFQFVVLSLFLLAILSYFTKNRYLLLGNQVLIILYTIYHVVSLIAIIFIFSLEIYSLIPSILVSLVIILIHFFIIVYNRDFLKYKV